MIEKLKIPELAVCAYGDTDRIITYILCLANKINEIIDHLPQEKNLKKKEDKGQGHCGWNGLRKQPTKEPKEKDISYDICSICKNECKGNRVKDTCEDFEAKLNDFFRKTSKEPDCCWYAHNAGGKCSKHEPTKEVPDIRPILERMQGENCQHTWKPINPIKCEKCKVIVDQAIQEISALYRKDVK